jgi:hypothetical protein
VVQVGLGLFYLPIPTVTRASTVLPAMWYRWYSKKQKTTNELAKTFIKKKEYEMPMTLEDFKAHREQFGLKDFVTMHTEEYRQALKDGAILWIDHHDFVRSTFSEEIFATNHEQLDALIQHLKNYRERMTEPPEWMSEK